MKEQNKLLSILMMAEMFSPLPYYQPYNHWTPLNKSKLRKISNDHKKYDRNATCFCGSGKKFKKCCIKSHSKYYLMKTIEQLIDETPMSHTGVDNPIYEINQDLSAMIYEDHKPEPKEGITINLAKGTRLRMLSCKEGEKESQFRLFGGNLYVSLDNAATDYISGNLGAQMT